MRPLVVLAGGLLALTLSGAAIAAEPDDSKVFSVSVSPYAGTRLGDISDEARPGARVEVSAEGDSEDRIKQRLGDLGVRDGAEFGGRGRWYLFAAGSGTAVGLNVRREADGDFRNYGFSLDPAALAGDAQAGVGWRKGSMQTSVGYMHRTFRPANAMANVDYDNKDDMVALSFSLKKAP